MRAASTASSQQELISVEQSDNRELVKAARGSYRTLAAVPLAATVVATITVAVEIARTAAREKVGQAKSRRRSRTPANSSAVPVALAVVRLRGARQGNSRGCDDKSCGSQCDTHSSCPLGSRPLALHFQYSGISPRQASPRHHGARRFWRLDNTGCCGAASPRFPVCRRPRMEPFVRSMNCRCGWIGDAQWTTSHSSRPPIDNGSGLNSR